MKSNSLLITAAVLLLFTGAAAEELPAPKSQKEKVSYGLGVDIGRSFKRQGIQADLDLVMQGLRDGLAGKELLIPEEELRVLLGAFQHELTRRQMLTARLVAEENSKKGEAFLKENKQKKGVVTLPSGLQYKILKSGDGRKPTETDTVECGFSGSLIDGTPLDSSTPDKPAVFKVSEVIAGWQEALQLMTVGAKWQLFVPPQLAYGEQGGGGKIGGNATLIFELELLAIQ